VRFVDRHQASAIGSEGLEVLVEDRGARQLAGSLGRGPDPIPRAADPQPVENQVPIEQAVLDQGGDGLVEPEHRSHGGVAEFGGLRVEVVREDMPHGFSEPDHRAELRELDDEHRVFMCACHGLLPPLSGSAFVEGTLPMLSGGPPRRTAPFDDMCA
jgi:hypothetical protein